jgi:hypothetical protein
MIYFEQQKVEKTFSKWKLRVVVIERPYDIIEHQEVQVLMGRMMALKIKGYQEFYPYGVLPVDDYDLISDHILLCIEEGGEVFPIMGMRSVTYSCCKEFCKEFPPLKMAAADRYKVYRQSIQQLIASTLNQGEEIGYNGSYTIDSEIRDRADLVTLTRDLGSYFLLKYYEEYGIKTNIAGATLRFKIDKVKSKLGYRKLEGNEGDVLPDFSCSKFFGEKISWMYIENPQLPQNLLKYNTVWKSRLTLNQASLAASRVFKKAA